MARCQVDVGKFPPGVRSIVLDYREENSGTRVRIGEALQPISVWTVPKDVYVRARFRDTRGRIWPGTEQRFPQRVSVAVEDRRDPAGLTWPEPDIVQDGPTLSVASDVPEGESPEEWDVEVVQTTQSGNIKDGLHCGIGPATKKVDAFAWTTGQDVAVRGVRREDGLTTPWTTVTVDTATPLVDQAVGHSNGFASGTIATLGGASGPATLEISGGDLRHKAIYIGDADGYIGDADDIRIGDAGVYWGPATYTGADVELDAVENVVFHWQPDLTSITRNTIYLGDAHFHIGGDPRIDTEDGTVVDPRPVKLNTTGLVDEVPTRVEFQVATDTGTSPTWSESDYARVVPGKVYKNVRTYSPRWVIRTWRGTRLTIDNLYCRHWTYCRSRPWHTHSDAGELIYEIIAGGATASFGATITAQNWDELRMQVLWSNTDATAYQLKILINGDTGSNYYKDGAAAATGILVGDSTLAQNWWEDVRVVFSVVKSGAERAVRVEHNRWNATTSEAPAAAASVMWDNTADPITSIQVLTTAASGSPFATGSAVRIWARKHHEA